MKTIEVDVAVILEFNDIVTVVVEDNASDNQIEEYATQIIEETYRRKGC